MSLHKTLANRNLHAIGSLRTFLMCFAFDEESLSRTPIGGPTTLLSHRGGRSCSSIVATVYTGLDLTLLIFISCRGTNLTLVKEKLC